MLLDFQYIQHIYISPAYRVTRLYFIPLQRHLLLWPVHALEISVFQLFLAQKAGGEILIPTLTRFLCNHFIAGRVRVSSSLCLQNPQCSLSRQLCIINRHIQNGHLGKEAPKETKPSTVPHFLPAHFLHPC